MYRTTKYLPIIFMIIVFLIQLHGEASILLIKKQDTKKVFIPHTDIGDSWKMDIDFDDSAWRLCEGLPGGIGYEKSYGYESLISLDVGDEMHDDGGNPNTGCYIRIPFSIASLFYNYILNMMMDL